MIKIILKENSSIKNPVVEHNVDFLLDDRDFATKLTPGISYSRLEEFARRLVSEIPTLAESKLVGNIGRGAEGVAFELSNGNVLKLGKDIRGSLETAKNSISDNFSKQGSAALPHIYNRGEIKMGSYPSLFWREMSKYTTFNEWLYFIRPGNKLKKEVFEQVDYTSAFTQVLMRNYKEKTGVLPSLKTLINFSYKYNVENNAILSELGKEFYERLIKAVYELGKRHDFSNLNSLDTHAGNLGVDQHGNLVFYDF